MHDVDVRVAEAVGPEGDPRAVGRPGRVLLVVRAPRQAGEPSTVCTDDVELAVPGSAAREGEPLRVRRPGGIPVVGSVGGDPAGVATVRARDVDLVVAVATRHVRDAGPVGRRDRLVVDGVADDDARSAVRAGCLGVELERADDRRVGELAVACVRRGTRRKCRRGRGDDERRGQEKSVRSSHLGLLCRLDCLRTGASVGRSAQGTLKAVQRALRFGRCPPSSGSTPSARGPVTASGSTACASSSTTLGDPQLAYPGDPRRRHQREVHCDRHDRAAPALGRSLGRLDALAPCRLVERAHPHRRRRGRLRGGRSSRPPGCRAPRGDAVRDRHRGCARRVRRSACRRRRRRGGARRSARCDQRPPHPGRPPHQHRARAHGRSRRHARGDRDREARSRARGRRGRPPRRHVRPPGAGTRAPDRRSARCGRGVRRPPDRGRSARRAARAPRAA